MNRLITTLSLALLTFFAFQAQAQTTKGGKTAIGVWKTVDDESGKVKSHVEIYEKNGKYYGKIIRLLHIEPEILKKQGLKSGEYHKVRCTTCPSGYGGTTQTVQGLVVMKDMEELSNKYGEGTIMDPKKGKEYTCTMWLEDANTLKVRGWVALFYRTQTWYRVK